MILSNKLDSVRGHTLITCVTAAGWRAGNTRLNFVRPGSNPVGARAGLLQQPGLLW